MSKVKSLPDTMLSPITGEQVFLVPHDEFKEMLDLKRKVEKGELAKAVATKLAKDLEAIGKERDSLKAIIKNDSELEEMARKSAAAVIGELAAFGDSNGVPTIADVVDSLKAKLYQVESDVAVMRCVLEEVAELDTGEQPCVASDAKKALASGSGQRLLDELAQLRATATRRLELIKRNEFADGGRCPECHGLQHYNDCPLAKELEAAP